MPDQLTLDLQKLFDASAARHRHLCPRQVLGVRAALVGARTIGLQIPRKDKRLLIISESDGCFVDGLEVAPAFPAAGGLCGSRITVRSLPLLSMSGETSQSG